MADEDTGTILAGSGDAGNKADAGTADAGTADAGKSAADANVQDVGNKADGDGGDKGKADVILSGAPDAYQNFTFPDGVETDAALVSAFNPIAKEMGLTQAQAQSVFNREIENAKAVTQAQTTAWDNRVAEWKTETLASDIDVDLANKALDAIARPELNEFLKSFGIGNNKHIVRIFEWIGKEIGNDNISQGRGGADNTLDAAEILYGSK